MTDRHGLYLTTGRDPAGRMLAMCSDGSPQLGHSVVSILAIEVVSDIDEATDWFKRMKRDRPWETRQ